MDITLLISVGATSGKSAIGNLEVVIYNENGDAIKEIPLNEGVGSFSVLDYMGITSETKLYTIGVKWVENLINPDINYEGNDFGSTIKVLASAVQCAHDSHDVENYDVEFDDVSAARSQADTLTYIQKLAKKTALSKYKSIFFNNGEVVEGVYTSYNHYYLNAYPSTSAQYAYLRGNVKVAGGDKFDVSVSKYNGKIVFMYEYCGTGFNIIAVSYSEDGALDELYVY